MSNAIEQLVQQVARLPGLGPRSARRVVLHLLRAPEKTMVPLMQATSGAMR
jgi:recombination protein RecR